MCRIEVPAVGFKKQRASWVYMETRLRPKTRAIEAGIRKPAFKIGVAFRDERGLDLLAGCSRQPELLEFINVAARRIADSHDLRRDVLRRDVDDTLLAPSKHLEAVVFVPDVAAYERGLESHHHVPAHRYDVGRALQFGANQDNRTGL
jgi:hypothetical protein